MRTVQTPASRRDDPTTSHDAERFMNASGRRGRQQVMVADLVRRYPDRTSFELAQYGELDRYQIARRLSELLTAGAVERSETSRACHVTARQAYTWRIKDPQGKLF